MIEEIKQTIVKAIPDAIVIVLNPQGDLVHFESIVISASFEGMPLVKQHQAVMIPLTEAFESKVHALALKTFSPQKWEQEKHKYNPDVLQGL